ncbi:MAG: hypothetical protein HZA95_03950 [Candidatus Vogelbacteria bacterium]|nr:hypothetical protein [Candidatus Vogelbacteria bacterium]
MENRVFQTVQLEVIKAWVEERNGKPARVKSSKDAKKGKDGILRIDFGEPGPELEPMSWKEFGKIFDEHMLAFLFQEETAKGEISHFYKFVKRKPKH